MKGNSIKQVAKSVVLGTANCFQLSLISVGVQNVQKKQLI